MRKEGEENGERQKGRGEENRQKDGKRGMGIEIKGCGKRGWGKGQRERERERARERCHLV